MNGFISAMALLLSIVLALALGTGFSYVAVTGVLRAFGHRPRKHQPALTEAAVGGD